MGLLDRFRAGGLRPAWTYAASGTLWRVVPAPPASVVGEDRDAQSRVASFFALELASGRVRWSQRQFLDDWWVGVAAVHGDVLLLHGFASPDMPGHRGVAAVRIATGKVLWADAQATLVEVRDERVLLSRQTLEGHAREERHLLSGEPLLPHSPGDESSAKESQTSDSELMVPRLVHSGAELDPEIAQMLNEVTRHGTPVWPVEIIDHPRVVVFAAHEKEGESARVHCRLGVVERNACTLLYEEVLQSGLRAPVMNMFSVVHDMLLFIKDGHLLRAIPL